MMLTCGWQQLLVSCGAVQAPGANLPLGGSPGWCTWVAPNGAPGAGSKHASGWLAADWQANRQANWLYASRSACATRMCVQRASWPAPVWLWHIVLRLVSHSGYWLLLALWACTADGSRVVSRHVRWLTLAAARCRLGRREHTQACLSGVITPLVWHGCGTSQYVWVWATQPHEARFGRVPPCNKVLCVWWLEVPHKHLLAPCRRCGHLEDCSSCMEAYLKACKQRCWQQQLPLRAASDGSGSELHAVLSNPEQGHLMGSTRC